MICPVHQAIASHQEHGVGYCLRCFWEAVDAPPSTSVAAMVQRLINERKRRQDADLRAVQRRLQGRSAT